MGNTYFISTKMKTYILLLILINISICTEPEIIGVRRNLAFPAVPSKFEDPTSLQNSIVEKNIGIENAVKRLALKKKKSPKKKQSICKAVAKLGLNKKRSNRARKSKAIRSIKFRKFKNSLKIFPKTLL